MSAFRWGIIALVLSPCLPLTTAFAQFGGSRAGVEERGTSHGELPLLSREVAESFIVVEGKAELRVKPTELRMVMAVTAEKETAQECQMACDATVKSLRAAWGKQKIPPENIVEDFIAVLPRYEWTIENRAGAEVGVEKRAGYRMQTNLHLAVTGDAQAQGALGQAFEQGVTDIIAFDYWSKDLDAAKAKARDQALDAARQKAESLLKPIFGNPPPAINVQEETTLKYPESLYHSFTNAYDAQVTPSFRRDVPFISAQRPRNTYYRGLYVDSDVQPRELPMKPEISVLSTVRLYYESPAAKRAKVEPKK